jgi:ribosomal protein S8E
MFRDAHAEDFERKKKPELGRDPRNTKVEEEDTDDDDSDDGEEQGDGDSGKENREGDTDEEAEDDDEQSVLTRIREDLEVGMSGARGARQDAVLRDE